MSALRTVEIYKTQFAGFSSETLNGAVEDTNGVPINREDAPGNATCLAPNLDPNSAGPQFKRVLAGRKAGNFLAILDHRGSAARFQKRFKGGKERICIRRLREFG